MPAATFDINDFLAMYPQFTAFNTANPTALSGIFANQAPFFLANNDCVIPNVAQRTTLLYMLTAHIAQLNGALSKGTSQAVGHLNMAKIQDVETRYDQISAVGASSNWYMQTQFGASFWAATAFLRTFAYYSPPRIRRGWIGRY